MRILNQLPHLLTKKYKSPELAILAESGKAPQVFNFKGEKIHDDEEFIALDEFRQKQEVHRYLIAVSQLNKHIINEATEGIKNPDPIVEELTKLIRVNKEAMVIYVLCHANPGPAGPLTVRIGGDCYREDQKYFEHALIRTAQLAFGMEKKAVGIFPKYPALQGGKKGEWMIIDAEGNKIEECSAGAKMALGSYLLPKGIKIMNNYLMEELKMSYPDVEGKPLDVLWPDSLSPDVFSGPNWNTLTHLWAEREELDMNMVTCLPKELGGVKEPSSNPTGLGVETTVILGIKKLFKRDLNDVKILVEAAGGVTKYFLKFLKEDMNGEPLKNVTVFDPYGPSIEYIKKHFPNVHTKVADHTEFYNNLGKHKFDVWVNNGLGNNTTPVHIQALIDAGVKFMTGGANNTLEEATREESLRKIKAAGVTYMQDQFVSGGGWTLALMGMLKRTLGEGDASDNATLKWIQNTIRAKNSALFTEAFDRAKQEDRPLHEVVEEVMVERLRASRAHESADVLEEAMRCKDLLDLKTTEVNPQS